MLADYEPELPSQLNLPEDWDNPSSEKTAVQRFLYPDDDELPDNFEVSATHIHHQMPAAGNAGFSQGPCPFTFSVDRLCIMLCFPLQMPIWDHLEELRERVVIGALAAGLAVLTCFAFSKDLVVFLEAPVASQGVRFLQLSPGEFFFTTLKVGQPLLGRCFSVCACSCMCGRLNGLLALWCGLGLDQVMCPWTGGGVCRHTAFSAHSAV